MEYIISDTSIIAVNRGRKSNEASSIIYRDGNGELHTIDFETCANNYKAEHSNASQHCIGERKIDESYFLFYTSGIKTKIVFDKIYVSNLLRHHFLRLLSILCKPLKWYRIEISFWRLKICQGTKTARRYGQQKKKEEKNFENFYHCLM